MRRPYHHGRYGRVRRAAPGFSRGPGMPARFFMTMLMVLAGIVVLASLIHLAASANAGRGPVP
jgi:hypothetical protein